MKTRSWVLLTAVLLGISLIMTGLLFFGGGTAETAEIYSNGTLLCTVRLAEAQRFTVEFQDGYNEITVRDGKIAVTAASCPDGCCMERGAQKGGAPIVCLPNRLAIVFRGDDTAPDAVVGAAGRLCVVLPRRVDRRMDSAHSLAESTFLPAASWTDGPGMRGSLDIPAPTA